MLEEHNQIFLYTELHIFQLLSDHKTHHEAECPSNNRRNNLRTEPLLGLQGATKAGIQNRVHRLLDDGQGKEVSISELDRQ